MNDLEFPEIETGNGTDRNLAATANDRLKKTVIEINKLTKTIEIFNKQSSKQTDKMIRLTRWIAFLTVVMILGLFYQIYLAIPKSTICRIPLTCETTYSLFLGKDIKISYDKDNK